MNKNRSLVRSVAAALCAAGLVVAGGVAKQPASAQPFLDPLGRPTPETVARVNAFADQPYVPVEVGNTLRTAVQFFAGTGELGGPALPADAPQFTQFYWPTVSGNCIGQGLHSTASAIAVPGPAASPAPGAGPGQTTFVFTALGTPAAAQEQGQMQVYWVNLTSLRTGVTPLGNYGINPAGPATLSATADTGSGHVLAVAHGSVRTIDNVCPFAPTAASIDVR
ncbi:Rv1157c family protein [Corynebacterium ureicelerivorans]